MAITVTRMALFGIDAAHGVRRLAARGAEMSAEVAGAAGAVLGAVAGATRALAQPSGLRGLVLETGWLAAHAALYPWGVLAEQLDPHGTYGHYRTETLSPAQRGRLVADVRAAGTPILLVHGFGDNRSAFTILGRALRRRGFGVVHGVNYSLLTAITGDVRSAARELGGEVERVCEQTGSDQVHVVGHSLGGLIARYYVQRLGGDERVRTLVTLGSPHGGSLSAYLMPTLLARQLRPGSEVITELTEPARGCGTRFLAIWSELDQVIIPQRNARLEHRDLTAVNMRLRDVGHLSLPVDSRVIQAVASALSHDGAHDGAHDGRPHGAGPPPDDADAPKRGHAVTRFALGDSPPLLSGGPCHGPITSSSEVASPPASPGQVDVSTPARHRM